VDFAAWCTYKYLNSGPGGIAGLFLNEKHFGATSQLPRLHGWWGNRGETRFQMQADFDPIADSANIYRMSNPCVLAMTALLTSLEIFETTSMSQLNQKSGFMVAYLEALLYDEFGLDDKDKSPFQIMTPSTYRGCQLSLLFRDNIKTVFQRLTSLGVVCDERKPNCIRIAAVPMYNSYQDVHAFVQKLELAISS
jgi:kynureninase